MHALMERTVRLGKLSYLWVTRILGAENHYASSLATKFRMNAKGFLADQYAIYDLGNNDADAYLSEFDWYRSRWINQPFDAMLNNKVVCSEVLGHIAKVPEVLAVKSGQKVCAYAAPNRYLSMAETLDIVRNAGTVFVKPIGMGKGNGVHRLGATPMSLKNDVESWDLDGRTVTQEEVFALLDGHDDWFLSRYVEQHEALRKLFGGSTNTVRIITFRRPEDGAVEVFFAVLRIGTSQTVPVDNASRGGLVARIDLENGTLSEARSLWSSEVHLQHPDTGEQIKGSCVPDWDSVVAEARALAERFPYLKFVAWDILPTDDGPCIIEANTSSGVNIIQLWGPQRDHALGEFYRAHGVIK